MDYGKNCNAYVLKKHPDSASLKVERSDGENGGWNKKKKRKREQEVDARLSIKRRTGEIVGTKWRAATERRDSSR